jgi:TolA-binding protein
LTFRHILSTLARREIFKTTNLDKCMTIRFPLSIIITGCMIAGLFGCKSSEEINTEPVPPQLSATELLRQDLKNYKSENETLKQRISKVEQDQRELAIRTAGLETEITDLKQKMVVPAPQKPTVSTFADPLATYQEALMQFHDRKYSRAASLFQSALDTGVPETYQDNCHYWMGECAYGERKFSKAIELFQQVFGFKISDKKDDAQLMVGNCYIAMGNKEKAKEAFDQFIKKFPASPYIQRVKEKLGKLQ